MTKIIVETSNKSYEFKADYWVLNPDGTLALHSNDTIMYARATFKQWDAVYVKAEVINDR